LSEEKASCDVANEVDPLGLISPGVSKPLFD
jgi:hypothetical protein